MPTTSETIISGLMLADIFFMSLDWRVVLLLFKDHSSRGWKIKHTRTCMFCCLCGSVARPFPFESASPLTRELLLPCVSNGHLTHNSRPVSLQEQLHNSF